MIILTIVGPSPRARPETPRPTAVLTHKVRTQIQPPNKRAPGSRSKTTARVTRQATICAMEDAPIETPSAADNNHTMRLWGSTIGFTLLIAAAVLVSVFAPPSSLSPLCQAKENLAYGQMSLPNKPTQAEFTQWALKMGAYSVALANAETGKLHQQQLRVASDVFTLAGNHQYFLHLTTGKALIPQSPTDIAYKKFLHDEAAPVLAAARQCHVCVTRPHEKICV